MSAFSRIPEAELNAPVFGYGSYHHRTRQRAVPRRPAKHVSRFFSGYEWLRISLTFATLGIAIYSVQRAKWIAPEPSLVLLLAAAILSTAVLMKLRLARIFKVVGIAALGGLVTVWQSSRLTGGQSLPAALSVRPNEGTIHFAVFIMLLTWAVGVFSIWCVLRKRNAWVPAGLGAAIILVNLSNLPPEHYSLLPVYLLVALAFIGLNYLANQRSWFIQNGSRYPARSSAWFVTSVLAISGLAVLGSSLVPETGIDRIGFDVSGQFISSLQKNWFNIFASVPGKWSIMRSEDLKTLSFSSPLDNRETVLFIVTSTQPAYWRINRYDNYSSWGWSSYPVENEETLKPGSEHEVPAVAGSRMFSYTVETRSKTDVLLLTGEFVSSSIPVKLATLNPASSLGGPGHDIFTVTAPQLLQPYQRYTPVVSVISTTPAQLAKAGTLYPGWVASHYLQLPGNLSPRIRQLALTITEGASDPYDQALAIQKYLRGLKYNRDAKSPSRRGDETDTFLFVQKEGVCTDFATAMVVMLRTLGIPARLATGYLSGQHDPATDTYLVRGKDYHAWPEVFFPEHGWIEFEPTPRPEISTDLNLGGSTGASPEEIPPEDLFVPAPGAVPTVSGDLPAKPRQNILFPVIVAVLFAASVVGVLWTVLNRLYQSLRLSSTAAGVYSKMCRLASLVGAGPALAETPLEYCHRLSAVFPEGSEAIGSIAQLYSESSFSPRKDLGEEQLDKLKKSWVQLYPVLFKRRLPWNRNR